MRAILAIDAAWTDRAPSGVALVQETSDGWRCLAVAPSYEEFLAQSRGHAMDWGASRFAGSAPDVAKLLQASRAIAGTDVDLVTIDMPVATVPIDGRRKADNDVSTEFGARKCATHTPNANRPGPLGAALTKAFVDSGYDIATTTTTVGALQKRLVEVYPHPALLSLLQRPERVPYKVSKSLRYWPDLKAPKQRIAALLDEFTAIRTALALRIEDLDLRLPTPDEVPSLFHLKRYEDALDALVCAWVGMEYLARRAVAFGDETAAIWCPT